MYVFCANSVWLGRRGFEPLGPNILSVRSEFLEVSEGLVCVLNLSEDHWFLPVFLEVWEVQLPAESGLDSGLIPRNP